MPAPRGRGERRRPTRRGHPRPVPRKPVQPNRPAAAPQRSDIVVYENGADVRLEVRTDGETVWLSQAQMCKLFGRDRSVITKHIRNVFKEGELKERLVCAKFAHTTPHGAMPGRTQLSERTLYNLDVVISVGYRAAAVGPSPRLARRKIGFTQFRR